MGFDSINTFGDVKVYKNKFSLPLGFTYNKTISENDFKKLSSSQKDFCLLKACVIANEDKNIFNKILSVNNADTTAPFTFETYLSYIKDLKKDNFVISKFTENNIIGDVATTDSKILFFSIPFDEGWKVKINGKDANLYRLNCGLTGLLTEKGNNKIELIFTPRYKNIGTVVSILSLFIFLGLLGISYFKNKSKNNSPVQ